MNTLVRPSHRITVLFEHSELVFNRLKIATHVAGIAVLRNQFESDFLAPTTDQQRNMWLLDAFGLIDRTIDMIIFPLEDSFFLRPQRQNDLDSLAQIAQALRSVGIVVAIGAIFVLIPAGTDAKIEAPVAQHVHGAG